MNRCRICKTVSATHWKEKKLCRPCANKEQKERRRLERSTKPIFIPDSSWRAIPGFTGYFISNKGVILSIRHVKAGRVRIQQKDERGYMRCNLYSDSGKVITHNVNRLMCMAWYGERDHSYDSDHKNKVRDDNRVENLRWLPVAVNRSS